MSENEKPHEQSERRLEELKRERCGRCGCPLASHEPVSRNQCTGCFHCIGFKSGGERMSFVNEPPKAA